MKLKGSEVLDLLWIAWVGCAALGGILFAIAGGSFSHPAGMASVPLLLIAGFLFPIAAIATGVKFGIEAARS